LSLARFLSSDGDILFFTFTHLYELLKFVILVVNTIIVVYLTSAESDTFRMY